MMKQILTLFRYWVTGEDSRLGRQEYWNHVFLGRKTPVNRFFWELSKAAFLIALSFYIFMGFMKIVL